MVIFLPNAKPIRLTPFGLFRSRWRSLASASLELYRKSRDESFFILYKGFNAYETLLVSSLVSARDSSSSSLLLAFRCRKLRFRIDLNEIASSFAGSLVVSMLSMNFVLLLWGPVRRSGADKCNVLFLDESRVDCRIRKISKMREMFVNNAINSSLSNKQKNKISIDSVKIATHIFVNGSDLFIDLHTVAGLARLEQFVLNNCHLFWLYECNLK